MYNKGIYPGESTGLVLVRGWHEGPPLPFGVGGVLFMSLSEATPLYQGYIRGASERNRHSVATPDRTRSVN